MKIVRVKKGGIVYFEDKRDKNVYIIKKGRIQLKKAEGYFLHGDAMKSSKVLKDGDAFGFEDIFAGVKRTERALAVTDCELISFEIEEFAEVIKKNIKIGERIVHSMAGRIRNLNNKIRAVSRARGMDFQYSSNDIKDIYYYFMKKGDLKKAFETLERMNIMEDYSEFATKEIKRHESYFKEEFNKECFQSILAEYSGNKKDKETLYFILEGLKIKTVEKELHERIEYEGIKILKENNLERYIGEAKKFFERYPKSIWNKILMFEIIEVYERDGEIAEQLTVVNKLSEQKLSKEEIKKVKEKLEKLKKKVNQG